MVDTVTRAMGNDNDDWEVAVDTGEFDKRLEQQEQDRATKQEFTSSMVNNDDSGSTSSNNLMKSNKPIRILKRPTSQSQLPVTNDSNNPTTKPMVVSNNACNNNSSSSNNLSTTTTTTTVPTITIIPRIQTRDSNSSSTTNPSNSSSSQTTKPPIKTYEQRELEYRLARLRIMGEEESPAKDDDDNVNPPSESTTTQTSDESTKTANATSTKAMTSLIQSHSTPNSFASNLYNLSNTGLIHFNPTNGAGPYSQQQYRSNYSTAYPPMAPTPPLHYPVPAFYMSSPATASPNYPVPSSMNTWYRYQQQNPYGTQQYDHPQ